MIDGWIATKSALSVSGPNKMSGQPRRTKCPAVDMAHMDELLQRQVKKYGVNGSFDLGAYMKIQTQNAINGPELSKLKNLVGSLMELETGMHFKFSDLKGSLQRCTLKFPDLRNKVEEDKRGDFEGTLASALLCVCAHVRRLKDATRSRGACSKCTDYEVEELKEMREWMSGDKSKDATWLDI